jgi:cytochrome oxidase Cu insertion factor (SCO1/SenC/PrrC family)
VPGMSSGLNANNPTIVHAFRAALLHQGLIALVLLAVVAIAWQGLRVLEAHRAAVAGAPEGPGAAAPGAGLAAMFPPEAPARRLLRVGFGLLWILDGFLQAQPDMPLGMTTDVIKPVAATSPGWVQHVANAGASIWSFHPIEAPASAVWIQVGIGLWLLVAPRGPWSRLAGLAGAGWGLVVWVFGEAFGGIFAPGLSWLFGAPGAALLYAVAGLLVAAPERWWTSPRTGRAVLGGIGLFFLGMALLQAWPGRGFWQGHAAHGGRGAVAAMATTMAKTPQPHVLSSWVSAFARFDLVHGFAVNLFVVVALAVLGAAFVADRPRLLPYALGACGVLCVADWVLVQDFGFFGGVGTDPNSMVPMLLLVAAGYLATTRLPAPADAAAGVTSLSSVQGTRERFVAWRASVVRHPAFLSRSVVALGAVGVVLLGAMPMAVASTNRTADPIIAQATEGTPSAADYLPKHDFHLVDQNGRPVSLASLRGKTVAITFLDPVCVSTCPIIGSEFRQADLMLGSLRKRVEMVAIVANPLYRARSYVVAYDRADGMGKLGNWLYLTGSLRALATAWSTFGVQVEYESGGAMIGHSEIAYVLDKKGYVREALTADPGPGTEASQSSFAGILVNVIRRVAASR